MSFIGSLFGVHYPDTSSKPIPSTNPLPLNWDHVVIKSPTPIKRESKITIVEQGDYKSKLFYIKYVDEEGQEFVLSSETTYMTCGMPGQNPNPIIKTDFLVPARRFPINSDNIAVSGGVNYSTQYQKTSYKSLQDAQKGVEIVKRHIAAVKKAKHQIWLREEERRKREATKYTKEHEV